MTEAAFQSLLLATLGPRPDLTLWRQMVGTAYVPRGPRGREVLAAAARAGHASVIDMGPPTGAADLSGIAHRTGRRIEIEVKGPTTRTTPEQVRWAEFIRSKGGIYVLARSPDLQATLAALEAQL
jgi:hypothetical protein